MPTGFRKIAFVPPAPLGKPATPLLETLGVNVEMVRVEPEFEFNTDEAAARAHVSNVLMRDERPGIKDLAAPDRPAMVPDFRLTRVQQVPGRRERLVHFEQMKSAIPIFGSRMIAQLDGSRRLIGVSGDVAQIDDVSPIATLSPAEALARIAAATGKSAGELTAASAPQLMYFFRPGSKTWHLVYLFKKLPVRPPDLKDSADAHHPGLGKSPRDARPLFDYLIDAHTGELVFSYSVAPMLDVPVQCQGDGETGVTFDFFGRAATSGFEMFDPLNGIKTYDLALQDIDSATLPANPVTNATAAFANHRAAVSAHAHATKVSQFYKAVLARDSVDDKGMDVVSIVNCTYANGGPVSQEWRNAVWFDNKMWYGQDRDPGGILRSFSRFLDVIAHEMTHGVTEHTANLVYRDQSGALNESFSDIIGIMIANWDFTNPHNDVGGWTWALGPGLGAAGGPLRDLSDPTRTGDPDHMNNYLNTTADNGGVHTNSNIHNKAAYNVITATNSAGQRVFTPTETAILYYLCLNNLSSLATFQDALEGLVQAATTFFIRDAVKQTNCVNAIRAAYASVGIQ